MKILVLGPTGMAGHVITLYLQDNGYDVTTFSRRECAYSKNIIGNIFDIDELKNILLQNEFEVVINCIGILNKNAEDHKSEAVYLNSFLPHFLADFYKDRKTRVIHMSTDCVFSGKTGLYTEESIPDGQTFYDRTKAIGEIMDDRNLTFRNSIIGPDINENGIGLFNWFMKQQGSINGFTGAVWTGVTTLTLAKAMESAIKQNLTGLYNLVNNKTITKFELLKLFNKHFKDDRLLIMPSDTIQSNKSLFCTREDFKFIVPSYEEMIIEMKKWILLHKQLYPHYFI